MIDVLVRPAVRDDLGAIVGIEEEAFPHPWKRGFFEVELGSPGRFNRVAVEPATRRVVGFLFAMYVLDEMHVNKIAVTGAFRRRGVAVVLMKECLAFARAEGIASVSLEVRESNAGARAFYRALAFEDVYRRPHYYPDGTAAIVMQRQL